MSLFLSRLRERNKADYEAFKPGVLIQQARQEKGLTRWAAMLKQISFRKQQWFLTSSLAMCDKDALRKPQPA